MNDITQLLELMDRPAFHVADGGITAANTAARARSFCPGTRIEDLLATGREEYREFHRGCLSLRLECCGESYEASVTAMDRGHLFTLDEGDADAGLRLLSLASQTLREPLGDVMALVEELPPDTAPETVARIQRGLYRMLRIVGNMAPHPAFRPELQDVDQILRELWEKTLPACESRGIRFTYEGTAVYSCVDTQLLTRAVHNLLSNSLKYAEPGGALHLELKQLRRSYQIVLRDHGNTPWPIPDPFNRHRREPGTGDGREGLGMGLRLVQLAASAHGGTVLLDSPEDGGVRATVTLPLRQDTSLRSPRLRISYSGERDPMLVELSDVLPPEFYKK